MERKSHCCTLATLAALVLLVSFPVRSWCKEDAYKLLPDARPDCCVREGAEIKRFDDIDYDSFVSLMGRRSAAQPNGQRNEPMSRKRHVDHILADLLGRRTREDSDPHGLHKPDDSSVTFPSGTACPCTREYLQTRRFSNHGFQHFL